MRNLLNFLLRYSAWMVAAIYVVISVLLLVSENAYQRHAWLTSANGVSAWVYGGVSKVTSYFNLKANNEDLMTRNALLEDEIVQLKQQLRDIKLQMYGDSMKVTPAFDGYSYVMANVINNSVSRPKNYLTLDRGSADGIAPGMGIVDQNGIVGVVSVVGRHSARAISLLNPDFRLSCKVKGTDFFGSLVWEGCDPAIAVLEELPRHVRLHRGDTIVTTGYSSVFPEGIIVGTIVGDHGANNNFVAIDIRLTTDFNRVGMVRVIRDANKAERDSIEQDIEKTE